MSESRESAPGAPVLSLFQGYGVEIEYMVVDRASREIRSIADVLLDDLNSRPSPAVRSEACPRGRVEWSNELVAHVAEAKCAEPEPDLVGFLPPLNAAVDHANALLAPRGACLMPSAAHPWMDPARDPRLWPHKYHDIYQEYDRIFSCTTHGWTNLQSVHLNLPFHGPEEFGRLHAAIRLVLPLVPALAAASPYLDGRFTGLLDARMQHYRYNSMAIPAMTGDLIPEAVFTPEAYRRDILEPIYAQSAPLDPIGILHDEWANARGAIARFDRNAIEIRVTDSQEYPLADLAVCFAVAGAARLLTEEKLAPYAWQKTWSVARLYRLFFDAVRDAERAEVMDPDYAALFGVLRPHATFGELWAALLSRPEFQCPIFQPWFDVYRSRGTLARRLLTAAGSKPDRAALRGLADGLCACLAEKKAFG